MSAAVPWSNEAEQAVLGAMLLDQDAALKAGELLDDCTFYREQHRLLFRAMTALAERGTPPDPIVLHDELVRRGDLERAGGMEYLGGLFDVVPTAANVEHHARIVREKYWRRRGVELAALSRNGASVEQLAATAADVARGFQQALAPERDRALAGYSDRDLLHLPDPEWVIDGLLPRSGLVLLVGRWGAGKTFVLTDVALHVAAGMPWQGRRVQPGPVLYVYAEGSMKLRVAAWRATHRVADADTVGVTFVPGTVNLLDATSSVPAFLSAVTTERLGPRPVLIVLETLSRMTPGGDENSPETAGLVIATCARIQRETRATVALSHHTPWSPDQQRPRGHTKLPDAADAVFLLDNADGALKLSCLKMRDAEAPAPIHLRLTPQYGALVIDTGAAPPPAPTETDELLAALGDGALTVTELADRLGVHERTVKRYLQKAGRLVGKTPGTGVGRRAATYHRLVPGPGDNPLKRGVVVPATANGAESLSRQGTLVPATAGAWGMSAGETACPTQVASERPST